MPPHLHVPEEYVPDSLMDSLIEDEFYRQYQLLLEADVVNLSDDEMLRRLQDVKKGIACQISDVMTVDAKEAKGAKGSGSFDKWLRRAIRDFLPSMPEIVRLPEQGRLAA